MAITYTFQITQLEIAPSLDGLTDVVTRVRYNYTGEDEDGNKGNFPGATPMPSPASGSFVPFNNLTPTEVISWLDSVADKPHMQEVIQEQINNQINPKHVPAQMPWGSGSAA